MTRIVVVGNGMVGSRFASDVLSRVPADGTDSDTADAPGAADRAGSLEVVVLGAEEYAPYNRVLLSEVVAGKVDISTLGLPEADDPRLTVLRGTPVIGIDRAARRVVTCEGVVAYDALVLATGAVPRIPDIAGLVGTGRDRGDLPAGAHGLRTLDDAREIVASVGNARHAVVVGAGVLGLEAACGLARRGVPVTVVHGGATLMDRQLSAGAGDVVARSLAGLGVTALTGGRTRRVVVEGGRVRRVAVEVGPDGDEAVLDADLLLLTAGTVPDVGLARAARLTVERGVVVGHDLASPDDPRVFAIGDCAGPPEGGTGLIAQGWEQSRRLADMLATAIASGAARRPSDSGPPPLPVSPGVGGRTRTHLVLPGADDRPSLALRVSGVVVPLDGRGPAPVPSPKPAGTDVVRVKAWGLEIVTMGLCGARRAPDPAHRTVALSDPEGGRHIEVVVSDGLVVGATCVGASEVGADLTALYTRRVPAPADPAQLVVRSVAPAAAPVQSPTHMPDRTTVCTCNGVTKGDIVACWRNGGARSVDDVARATRATTGCGGCKDVVCGLVDWLGAGDPDGAPAPAALNEASLT